jgi:hypothetical protein
VIPLLEALFYVGDVREVIRKGCQF